jgi:hypothetical protein
MAVATIPTTIFLSMRQSPGQMLIHPDSLSGTREIWFPNRSKTRRRAPRSRHGDSVSHFLLSAIGLNRMRQENADAHQNENYGCNIQHRTGPKAQPDEQNMHGPVRWRAAATFLCQDLILASMPVPVRPATLPMIFSQLKFLGRFSVILDPLEQREFMAEVWKVVNRFFTARA